MVFTLTNETLYNHLNRMFTNSKSFDITNSYDNVLIVRIERLRRSSSRMILNSDRETS